MTAKETGSDWYPTSISREKLAHWCTTTSYQSILQSFEPIQGQQRIEKEDTP
jgi:hypothetical protein